MTLNTKYFSLSQIAVMKGITTAHLRRLVLTGKIPAEKVGNSWLVKKSDVDKIKRQRKAKQKDI